MEITINLWYPLTGQFKIVRQFRAVGFQMYELENYFPTQTRVWKLSVSSGSVLVFLKNEGDV